MAAYVAQVMRYILRRPYNGKRLEWFVVRRLTIFWSVRERFLSKNNLFVFACAL